MRAPEKVNRPEANCEGILVTRQEPSDWGGGNCWDNAVAENFFKILKSEMVKHVRFHSILQARREVFEFIEIWYDRKRKHAYLGYKTPEQYGKISYSKCA